MIWLRAFIVAGCMVFLSPVVQAQVTTDSLSLLHSPKKATLLSTALPGAGQAYNKKYWKIPVIYAGFAGLSYLVKVNHDDYLIYKNAFRKRLDGDESTIDPFVGIYSDNDLSTLKDFYRRNRDLSIIGIGVLYVLNILDASVDAHLFHFNVNDQLTLQLQPSVVTGPFTASSLSVNLRF